jgi:hypothetical protein
MISSVIFLIIISAQTFFFLRDECNHDVIMVEGANTRIFAAASTLTWMPSDDKINRNEKTCLNNRSVNNMLHASALCRAGRLLNDF